MDEAGKAETKKEAQPWWKEVWASFEPGTYASATEKKLPQSKSGVWHDFGRSKPPAEETSE